MQRSDPGGEGGAGDPPVGAPVAGGSGPNRAVSDSLGLVAAMEGYDLSTYGERFAPVYDRWYGEVSDVDGTVARMNDLANSCLTLRGEAGPAARLLELGIGSGRLALPLAAAGLAVTGIDSSPSMVALLNAKPGAGAITVIDGDMTRPDELTAERFDAVLVAFNTFFNLPSAQDQQRCFEGVARVLEPGGFLVVEAFVPHDDQPPAAVSPTQVTADHVVLTATIVDAESQTIRGQHIDITEAGIALRPWFLRYASPSQLDEAAAEAGLKLVDRHADWHGQTFDQESLHHVSTYQLPT